MNMSKFNGSVVPVVYNVNFRDPAGYFLATKFQMKNKDVVYTSNSASVEASKFMQLIVTASSAASGPINTGISAYTLKNFINGTANAAVITGTP